jgi:hypothetical protein
MSDIGEAATPISNEMLPVPNCDRDKLVCPYANYAAAEIERLLALLKLAADAYNNGGEDECCVACMTIADALEQKVGDQ